MQTRRHAGASPARLSASTPEVHTMAYYTKVLQPDEQVKYVGKLHWIIYRSSILLGLLAIVVAIFSATLDDNQRFAALIGAAILVVLAIMAFLKSWFLQWTTETVVTDKRIIHKGGFIARRTQEMNITKVETVDVLQPFWGRILGYGTVRAIGTGASLETLPYMASPLQLRSAIIAG
jgi:uncharacterized membrane protein YdbT with pleckstrin-like domain